MTFEDLHPPRVDAGLFLLPAGVALFVDGLEPGMFDMGVDLSCANTGVPQQFLQCTNFGSIGQHMGGKTVPQSMWRDRIA